MNTDKFSMYLWIEQLFKKEFGSSIKSSIIMELDNQFYIQFKDNSQLWIVYSRKGYGFQYMFSKITEKDRIRFDSIDKHWKVETSPHHFHPRFEQSGFRSPMNGNYKEDVPLLIELIKSKKLLDPELRF